MSQSETPIKTRIVRVKHKNGTTYVERRQFQYDPKRKFNVPVKSERIGKICPETGEIIPCRPKRKAEPVNNQSADIAPKATATRTSTGGTDLLEWAGRTSGLDAKVRAAFSAEGIAQKILSVARYWVMTGLAVNRIGTWQLTHDLPYLPGMTPDICYALFDDLGLNETGMQRLFQALANDVEEGSPVFALDSTTTSSHSKNLEPYIRDGFNKAGDGLATYKLVTFYSIASRLPVSFEMQPGNISDVSCVTNAIKRAQSYGLRVPEFILDNGFMKRDNICALLRNHIQFTGRATLSDNWVGHSLDDVTDVEGKSLRAQFEDWTNVCPFDHSIHGVSTTQMIEFSWARERKRGEKDVGQAESQKFRLYIHFYLNINKAHNAAEELKNRILNLKSALESGTALESLSDADRKRVERFLILSRAGRGGKLKVALNNNALQKAILNSGIFCLISNKHKDKWAVLKRYRMRNRIEDSYRTSKNELDGDKARVWSVNKVRGKEFCRMVALGYHFYLQVAVNKIKAKAKERAIDTALTQEDRNAYAKLGKWLDTMTLHQILDWFDCVETVTVKNSNARKRWSTEATKRDQLFIKMLREERHVDPWTDDDLDAIPGESLD